MQSRAADEGGEEAAAALEKARASFRTLLRINAEYSQVPADSSVLVRACCRSVLAHFGATRQHVVLATQSVFLP